MSATTCRQCAAMPSTAVRFGSGSFYFRRRLMLSDTLLDSFRPITHLRRTGLTARVAQFRSVTGSGDPSDLELGSFSSVDPQAPGASSGPGDAAAASASSGTGHSEALSSADRVAQVVQQELARRHLEELYAAQHQQQQHSTALQQQQHQQHRQHLQDGLPSRDHLSAADDELLPLLADAAAHPISSRDQQQQHHAVPLQQQQHQQQLQQAGQAAAAMAAGAAAAAPADADAAGPAMMSGGIPRSIFVLSMVSMALTSASCVFNTLLPIYMVTELKMTMRTMGMFEGMLEAFSYVVRMFSGVISDRMTSRKAAITAGFIMGAAAKFGMSFATSTVQLFMTKAVDRLGNGVQAAPRDALIGDLSPSASRSACFGFAQSMRKWGSFMGAGLAFALMKASDNNYRAIFLLASAVSALSTLAFVILVPAHANTNSSSSKAAAAAARTLQQQQQQQQSAQQHPLRQRQPPSSSAGTPAAAAAAASKGEADTGSSSTSAVPQWVENVSQFWRDVRSMGVDFYRTLSVIALYGLGHINESLLEARAIEVGFGKAESTLVVALLCFSVFLCAYPLGRLDDKYGHATTFALGMASLMAGDLVLLFSGQWPWAVFGPMLSAVVGMAPPHLKGTAFGIFYTMMALVAMAANTMFGSIWHAHSATSAFALSALIIAATMLLTPLLLPESAKRGRHVAAAAAAGKGGGSGGASSGGLKPAAA
ncbi:major facilitator superfamily domain-containing protein [Scenedesmus sp. NREL 46B-D3]|nr:major facilitator superfamily domain-containing protein [Scenedesmus sp. NREL 46B-D3]